MAQPISCVQYLEEWCWHLCASAHRNLGVALIGNSPIPKIQTAEHAAACLAATPQKLLREQSVAVSLCQHINETIYCVLLNIYSIFTPEFEQKILSLTEMLWTVRNDATYNFKIP